MSLARERQGLSFFFLLGLFFILFSNSEAMKLLLRYDCRGAVFALEAPVLPPVIASSGNMYAVPVLGEKPEKISEDTDQTRKEASLKDKNNDTKKASGAAALRKSESKVEQSLVAASVVPHRVGELEIYESSDAEETESTEDTKIMSGLGGFDEEFIENNAEDSNEELVLYGKAVSQGETQKPVGKRVAQSLTGEYIVVDTDKDKNMSVKMIMLTPSLIKKVSSKPLKRVNEEIETELPPEWNWFTTPLKLEVGNGKIEIVASKEVKPASVAVVEVESAIIVKRTKRNEVDIEIKATEPLSPMKVSKVASSRNERAVPVVKKPFSEAMAKMAILRQQRELEAKVSVEDKNDLDKYRSVSLEKIRKAIIEMRMGTTANALFNVVGISGHKSVIDESESHLLVSPKNDEVNKLRSFYSGSGSVESRRISKLISDGFKSNLRR